MTQRIYLSTNQKRATRLALAGNVYLQAYVTLPATAMRNNFPERVRFVFYDNHPYCRECGSNQMCSIHHLFGRESNSAYNAIVLCHECHSKADGINTGGLRGHKKRLEYLKWTITDLHKWQWVDTPEDKKFLMKHEQDLHDIINGVI